MTPRKNGNPDRPPGAARAEFERYAEIRLEADGALIYDTERETAWVQSESAVDLVAMA